MAAVLSERQDALAIVTLNRPERRNGLTLGMTVELYDALQEIAASDARVVVLRGAGNDFCVGADMQGAGADEDTPRPSGFDDQGPIYNASLLLHTMPQVTIAAIDGGCAGAGMGWAAACDLRWGTPEARLSTAFLAVAASGDMGLIWSLSRIVGGARAREMLFFPEKLTGEQALELPACGDLASGPSAMRARPAGIGDDEGQYGLRRDTAARGLHPDRDRTPLALRRSPRFCQPHGRAVCQVEGAMTQLSAEDIVTLAAIWLRIGPLRRGNSLWRRPWPPSPF
jgi:Enoyl-CoA hydratase/isomerase